MNTKVALGVAVLILILGGGYYFLQANNTQAPASASDTQNNNPAQTKAVASTLTAVAGSSVTGKAPLTVRFNLVNQSAGDEDIDFGDGKTAATGPTGGWPAGGAIHTYTSPGTYSAKFYSHMPTTLLVTYTIVVSGM